MTSIDAGTLALLQPRKPVTWEPEPEPEPLYCPIISVDDHLLEPVSVFEGRVPAALADRVPHVEFDADGCPWWLIDDQRVPVILTNGCVGRPISQWAPAPARYDEMRPAVWDARRRLADMDLCGIWASLCFGSIPWGFAGSKFSRMQDAEVGLASLKAYNDWIVEEWCSVAPDRYIPCQFPWLQDPAEAARLIRANAHRGFKAVSFPENPEPLGFPSVHDHYWDPFFDACQETETVINLHVGSSGQSSAPSSESPSDVWVALFPISAISACVDWIYARVPLRFPRLQIALSEGGASWVPMVIERLRRAYRQVDASMSWSKSDPDPVEVLRTNFNFCSIEDPMAYRSIEVIGEDRLMVETDYPHQDSSWPYCQALVRHQVEGVLTESQTKKVCFENAARLYGCPTPPESWQARSIVR